MYIYTFCMYGMYIDFVCDSVSSGRGADCFICAHLQVFSVVFQKAVLKAEPDEDLKQRVSNLTESITSSIFQYTTRGLFECDKLTFVAQLTFQVPPCSSCRLF